MGTFNEHYVRPGVFFYSPKAHKERLEVKGRRLEAQKHYRQAQERMAAASFEEAEALLDHAIAAWPDNPKFLLALANCISVERGDPNRALPRYNQVIAEADTPSHRVARGRCLAAYGRLREALDDYDAAVQQEPQNGHYLKLRGMIKQRAGQYSAARDDYTTALPLLKESGVSLFDCLFNRGYCNRQLGSADEAIRDLEAASVMNSGNMNCKVVLGAIYKDRKEYRRALDLFATATNFDRLSPAAANNLALMQYIVATVPDEEVQRRTAGGSGPSRTEAAPSADTPARGAADGGTKTLVRAMGRHKTAVPDHSADAGAKSQGVRFESTHTVGDDDGDDDIDSDAEPEGEEEAGSKLKKPATPRTQRQSNEHPKQWAINAIAGSASVEEATVSDPAKMHQLQAALRGFTTALALFRDPATRYGAGAKADAAAGVYAINVDQAVDIEEGVLLILSTDTRIPGTPAIHEREMQDGELQYNRGLVLLSLGRLVEAEADLQEALVCNAHHAHYPHYQAVVAARKGDYPAAVDWNQRSLALNPRYFQALIHLGLILHLLSRNAEAVQLLDSALALQPRAWRVMEARGRVLQELDRHPEALPSLREALRQMDPDQPPSVSARLYHAIAQSAIATHQTELLQHALKQARIHGQDPASVYNLQGLLAMQERRVVRALKYMTRAIKYAPKEARFYFDRSQCYMQQKQHNEAIQDMAAALELLPLNATLLYHRGLAYMQMSNDDAALADFEAAAKAVAHEPGGRLQPDPRLLEGSRMLLNTASAADLTPMLWYRLGCTRARLGHFAPAADALQTSCQLLRGHPALLHELAKACQGCGRFAQAAEHFSKVLEQQPWNVHALFRRGLAYKSLKRYDEAAADIEAARRLDPKDPALQVDYKALSTVDVLELCRPGEEVQIKGF